MLKSIYKNNTNRKMNRKITKTQLIILCLMLILFSVIFNLYNSN